MYKNEPFIDPSYEINEIPEYFPSGKPMQFLLSAYSLQTLFWALYQGNILNLTISQSPTDLLKLDTTNLGTFLPGLVTEFGKGRPCMINVIPAAPPHVNITDEDIEIDAEINVSFLCLREGATEYEKAVTIRNKANFTGGIDISNLLTIHGHITEIVLFAEEAFDS